MKFYFAAIQSFDTKFTVVSLMGVLENSDCVLFGMTDSEVLLTRVILPKSTAKSVKTSSTDVRGRRWGHGLSLLNPLRILLDPFDVLGTPIADGMAELYGCPLLDGKHCIALSLGYEIKIMNSLEEIRFEDKKDNTPAPTQVRMPFVLKSLKQRPTDNHA